MRIVDAIKSPWLRTTLDTGNFLDDMYPQMERIASAACLGAARRARSRSSSRSRPGCARSGSAAFRRFAARRPYRVKTGLGMLIYNL